MIPPTGGRLRSMLAGALGAALILCCVLVAREVGGVRLIPLTASALSMGLVGVLTLMHQGGPPRRGTRSDGEFGSTEDLLQSILESVADGILTLDLNGRIISYNSRFLELWGIDRTDLAGGTQSDLRVVLDLVADRETFSRQARRLRDDFEIEAADVVELRSGRVLHRTTRPHLLNDRIVGRVWIFRDITEQRRTELELEEWQRRFTRMATNLPGVIFQFYIEPDRSIWFNYLSDGCQDLLAIEPGDFPWRADSLTERIHPDDMEALREQVNRSGVEMQSWAWEGRLSIAPGMTRWIRAASRPTHLEDGRLAWDGLLMDVTEVKTAVEALHRREEQLAEAQRIAHIGSWEWDLNADEITLSTEHWHIFGLIPHSVQWSFEHYLSAIHPEDRATVQSALERSLGSGRAMMVDYRIIRPDGVERFVTSRGKAILDSEGRAIRIVGTVQDVTDRRDAAAALEKRVAIEQALTRAARALSGSSEADVTRVLELVGRAVGCERAYLLESRPEAEMLLMDCTFEWCAEGVVPAAPELQGIDTATAPWWVEQLKTQPALVLNTLRELPSHAVLERRLLESHDVLATAAVPLIESRRGLIGFIGFDRVTTGGAWCEEDIRVLQTTAEIILAYFSRVKAEREVERREGILQAVSHAAERFLRTPDWEAGLENALALIGGAAGVSRAYLFETRTTDDDSVALTQRAEWVAGGIEPQMPRRAGREDRLGDFGLERWEELFRRGEVLQAVASGLPARERLELESQNIRSVLQLPIHVGEEWWGILGFDDCIEEREWSAPEVDALRSAAGMIAAAVERKRSGEALRESEERFRQMAESMREVFFMVSIDAGEVIYLSPSYELVWGRPRTDTAAFLESILPEDRHVVLDDMRLSAAGAGDPLRIIEYRIARPDGSIRWIRHRTFQVLDDSGRPYRVTGVCSDITDQKQLEEELRRTNRMEAIGHLAAGIAHEINTPIQYVGDNVRFLDESHLDLRRVLDAYAALMVEAAAGGPIAAGTLDAVREAAEASDLEYLLAEAPRATAQALEGVQRVAEIVRAMKEFSHPGAGQKRPTDLNQAILSTTTVARNEWKYVAELITDLDPSLPLVTCDQGELNQAILNLVVNAAHAIADRIECEGPGAQGVIIVKTGMVGDGVEIRVTDTGTGIPEAIRSRVFDPFFTTKEVGRGTGQGLTFVHSIVVDRHGGTVGFESEAGVGTTFIVRLPIVPPVKAAEVVYT